MIKQNKGKAVASSLITLLPIGFGLAVWNQLPDQMPMHWGVGGEVDGYADRAWAVIGFPILLLALHWVCVFATLKDPKNKEQTAKVKDLIWWLVPCLSLLVSGFMYSAALGYAVNTMSVMGLFMGALFVVIGNYIPKCKQNHTIGLRIPWTLNDEQNWNATHRVAGKVWVTGGLAMLVCSFLPFAWMPFVLLGVFLVLPIVPIVYSYRYYKTHQ